MFRFCFFMVLLALAQPSFAVTLDKKVRDFLQQPDRQELSVIALFHSDPMLKTDRVSVENFLKDQVHSKQTLVQKHLQISREHIQPLWLVHGVALQVSQGQLKTLLSLKELQSVQWADEPVEFSKQRQTQKVDRKEQYTYGLENIKIPELRQQYPHLMGKGVRVGVTDTGIINHPDLKEALWRYKDFSPEQKQEPDDDYNHGTHVAGTIAGNPKSGKKYGVAPEVSLIVARLFGGGGGATSAVVVSAMEWVADPDGDPATEDHAQIMNNSWASGKDYSDLEPMDDVYCRAVANLGQMGILTVFGSGNTGPEDGTVAIPGACPGAISVGAVESNDRPMYFSGVGPAQWKSETLMKPEVVAPGFQIISASAGGGTKSESGTSFAAPHATGVLALLKQAYPQATPEQLTQAMTEGTDDLGKVGHDKDFGWGRLNVMQSLQWLEAELGAPVASAKN